LITIGEVRERKEVRNFWRAQAPDGAVEQAASDKHSR